MITHNFSRYEDIQVLDNVILRIDMECELSRMRAYEPLLGEWGTQFKHDKKYPVKYLPYVSDMERCYDVAFDLACKEGLVYCEGVVLFMTKHGLVYPLGHGWCCTRDGDVIDPTMWMYQTNPRMEYLGIPIKKEIMADWFKQVGYTGILDGFVDGRPSILGVMPALFWYEGIDYDD